MTEEQNNMQPSLRKTIGKTTYEVVVHFNEQSTQTVEDRLQRVILMEADKNREY